MRRFVFNKLVRDKIPADQRSEGSRPVVRVLDGKAYLEALRDKLLEEGQEIELADSEEVLKELADLQEVIDCMVTALGATKADIETIQQAKRAKAGSFRERQYIETIEVRDDNPWIERYTASPDKYPEIK